MDRQALVHEAVRLTFEEMAFLDVAPGGDDAALVANPEGPVLYLAYSHPRVGALALFLAKEIKFEIAEAIYGESWKNLTAGQLDDSLLELLNVLAGRLLTETYGSSGYKMGLPTVLFDPPEDFNEDQQTRYGFHSDDREFALVWYEVSP